MELGRIGTAMVTPFDAQGQIDEGLTHRLVEHLITNGTDSLIINGTTGESPTVTREEKLQMLRWVKDAAKGRVPIIAGTGSYNTAESIEMTKEAEELGVDGVMLVVPYYNKPNQPAMYRHFSTIAEETKLPVLLYNIPGRSGVNMTAETTIALSKVSNIRAVKEASGDIEQMAMIVEGAAKGFSVYSGDDGMTLPLLSIGGKGVISVAAHVLGNEMQQMMQAFEQGEFATAAQMHRRLLPAFKALFSEPNPVPLKHVLNRQSIEVGSVRLPLIPLEADHASFDASWDRYMMKIQE
ncbi:4-hydroxy-tetrahydrodipicolinate synthase [Savagea sp. SN6]|uniref:4-hydroxy-tetrahydrodipicolinate synthase n=1 Tax=Savagea serpentis TaxID=2785297 RepID=A0A8J7KDG0_9BACL|nr:4-hydroxy-tetrahydrodipicolinate synthase [Savagea serpentis]MBF4499991.1 4-hydroxy-tetrahydrodipicolinate synthase [Savagea serpentis]